MRSKTISKLAGRGGRPGRWAQPLLAVAAVALVVGAARAQLPNWRLRVRQTAKQSLTMLTPSSPDFTSVLSGVFPSVWGEAGFARVRPHLVIVRNDTPLPAVAYALVWTVRAQGGYVGHRRRFFVNTAFVPRIEETVIAPGALRLVSSVASVAPDGPLPGLFSPSNYPPRAQATVTGVSLDGVVYSDGSFIGPNSTHLLQRYVAARFAAQESSGEQFDSSGLPYVDADPDGIGISQVDGVQNPGDVDGWLYFNFEDNIEKAIGILDSLQSGAYTFWSKQLTQSGDVPIPTADDAACYGRTGGSVVDSYFSYPQTGDWSFADAEWMTAYNGTVHGYFISWNGVTFQWQVNYPWTSPTTGKTYDYVHAVCARQPY